MSEEKSIFGELYDSLFSKSMPMWIGSILLAGMSMALFVLKSPFGATSAYVNWGSNIYGWDVTPVAMDFRGIGLLAVIAGAFAAALLSKEFSIKIAPPGELVKGFIGGLLMAFGAVVGKGCTLGGFFTGMPMLNAGALIYAVGLMLGALVASKWILYEMEKWPGISDGKKGKSFEVAKKVQPFIGFAVVVFVLLLPILFGYDVDQKTQRVLIGFIIISLFMGIVLQRSKWCVVRALREPWMSGSSEPAKAIIAGILVSLVMFTAYKFSYGGSIAMAGVGAHFWLRALIGSFFFGIGMTIAGGCAVGAMWRTGEGHVKLLIAVLSFTLIAPLVSRYIMGTDPDTGDPIGLNKLFTDMGQKEKVFLPDVMGYGWSIVLVLGFLLLWYLFATWNDRTGKFSAM